MEKYTGENVCLTQFDGQIKDRLSLKGDPVYNNIKENQALISKGESLSKGRMKEVGWMEQENSKVWVEIYPLLWQKYIPVYFPRHIYSLSGSWLLRLYKRSCQRRRK